MTLSSGCHFLIPLPMRRQALEQLHESHQGMVHTKERAKLVVYWSGMEVDIENTILSCKLCQDSLPLQQMESIILKCKPQWLFQEIAADYCTHAGQKYLITVDFFSKWLEITLMSTNTTTTQLILSLKSSFCCFGDPDKLWSYQGPQFTSKAFQDFAKQWGFQHITSSPRYPKVTERPKLPSSPWKFVILLLRRPWQTVIRPGPTIHL